MSVRRVCSDWASSFIVPASCAGEDYMVKFFTTHKATCTCPAYRYSGDYDEQTCKHIKLVKECGCFWLELTNNPAKNMLTAGHDNLNCHGITHFSTTKEGIIEDEACPSCGRHLLEIYI